MTPAGQLLHDVGKYIARTARNWSGQDADADLLSMLARDLYELGPSRERASALFERLAAPLAGAPLDEPRALLAEIDRLEPAVRAGETPAVVRAIEIARRVEQLLRALVRP